MTGMARRAGPLALAAILWGASAAAHACTPRVPTPQTGPGPHDYTSAAATSTLWHEGDEGAPLSLRGRVMDICGRAVVGARIRIVHANHHGEHEPDRWRTHLESDARGAFRMVTVFPGYTGGLARHIHFIIEHPQHQRLVTRLFFKNDPAAEYDHTDLVMVLEEVRRGDGLGWVASYEFVLSPP